MLNLRSLLEIPTVEVEMGFDVSPDGNLVAFSWNRGGNWDIYVKNANNHSEPILITEAIEGAKFHPRFSSDGKKIAYVVDSTGSEAYHLIILDLENHKHHEVIKARNENLQANYCWSPDGTKIAYISDKTGQFDVYILDLNTGETIHFLDAGYPAWKVAWSPNGCWLAITTEAGGIDYNTLITPIEDNNELFSISEKGKIIDAGQVAWSPDSTRLAFSSDTHGFNDVGIINIQSREVAWLTNNHGENQFPSWSPDGGCITYIHNEGTRSWLALQELDKSPRLHQIEPGVHYHPQFSKDGKRIFLVFDNPQLPGDIWSYSLGDGNFDQVTYSMPQEIKSSHFIMPEEIHYQGMDGVLIPALLFKPSTKISGKAVIIIHGGPDWFFEMTWYPVMAHMASRGWVVLAPNYRGSTGYGRAWQESSRFDFGGVDNDDVAAGVEYLVENGLAQAESIAITGRSHGGYLTMMCMTKYPDLWAAGSAIVPFINWFTNHELIRADLQHWDYENFGDPVINHDLWKERSPYYHLENILAPVQLIAGRNDQRCPVSDSFDAYEILKKLGKTAELLVYEDEGHTFLKRENIIESEIRRVEFLARFLEKKDDGISSTNIH